MSSLGDHFGFASKHMSGSIIENERERGRVVREWKREEDEGGKDNAERTRAKHPQEKTSPHGGPTHAHLV